MIAVTGATGLLGSFVVRKLLETGTPFVALRRKISNTSLLSDIDSKITWRDADVLDPIALQEALSEVDGVIHAAALVSFNPRQQNLLFQNNIEGTRNVVNACLANNIKRLLHVSSVAALGRQKNQTVVNENNTWQDSSYNTTYGESKYKAELEVFRGQEEGLSTVIVNPSVILSRCHWSQSSAKLFDYVRKERLFYTDGSFNYVDVRDVANIIYLLYHSPVEGERFILNAGSINTKEFFDQLSVLLNKKAPRYRISKTALRVVAWVESVRSLLTGSDPLITNETVRFAGTHFFYENQKVTKATGYQFQTIDGTLQWCAEFYRKQMNLKN